MIVRTLYYLTLSFVIFLSVAVWLRFLDQNIDTEAKTTRLYELLNSCYVTLKRWVTAKVIAMTLQLYRVRYAVRRVFPHA